MTAPVTGEHRIEAERLAATRPTNWPQGADRYVATLAQALADAEARGAARVSLEATTHGGDQ